MRRPRHQSGVTVIVVLGVLLLFGAYVMLSSVNFGVVRVERDRATNDALAKAKQALVAYAVSDPDRPGELPCPDVNDDGELVLNEDFDAAGTCTSRIGRLPWRHLNIPDLRDDSGERLWYAVSEDFRAGNTVALNNDTAYRTGNASLRLLTTSSGLPASPDGVVVALVFAPGATLRRTDGVQQVRGCTVGTDCDASLKCNAPATNTPKCNPRNYLDIALGEDNADLSPPANPQFVSIPPTETFNDHATPIYSDDIMRLVQRRAGRELAARLRDHFDAWDASAIVAGVNKGFYPYAAPFDDPGTPPSTPQVGTNGTLSGAIPLATTPLVWSSPSLGCSVISAGRQLDCNTLVVCIFGICLPSLSARINNVATRFVDPPQPANVQVLLGLSLGGAATWTLNKAQRRLDFSYGGFVAAGTIHIVVDAPATSSWLASSWLLQNNWNQNIFYGVAAEYAVDGSDACGGSCLTVQNTAAPNNNKQAVLVMTGRALSNPTNQMPRLTSGPPAALANYLEGQNTAAGTTLVFEQNLPSAAFNDLPIVVRP